MGQKVHPFGFRLSIRKNWLSKWYSNKRNFAKILGEDVAVRSLLKDKLQGASVCKIQIERPAKSAKIIIFTAKPGVIIGKKGEDIEKLRMLVQRVMSVPVHVVVEEVRKPDADAAYVADSIAQQIQKRIQFRRAMKRSIQAAQKSGVLGVKIMLSGRLNGIDIARSEWYREGRVPLHTLKADVDYGFSEALTTYGIIGIKVWLYKGELV
jgi:small subunit ribosomal protein S3